MDIQAILLGIFILVLLIVLFYKKSKPELMPTQAINTEHLITSSGVSISDKYMPTFKSYYDMSDKEKIDYVYQTYFTGPDEIIPTQAPIELAATQSYINSLPLGTNCANHYNDCHKWAKNQECVINPEFMLYACPHSCQACALTDQQKYDLVRIYNSRPPPKCAYHGESYPDRLRFLREIEHPDTAGGLPMQ